MQTRAGREIRFESWWTEHGTLVVEAKSGGDTVGSLGVTVPTDGPPYVDMVSVSPGWKNEGVATLLCWKAAVEVYAAGHPSLGMPDCQSPAGWALFRKFRKLMVRSRGSRKIFDLCKLEPWLQDPSQWMSSANTSGLPSRLEAGPLRGSGSVERLLPVLPSSTSVTQKGS